MQWIKHMTDMVDDPKIRRLIRKHGALGYAVYNLSIERIGKRLTSEHVLPDLEETSEDIADLLREDTVKVERAMLEAMTLGLFEQDELTGRLLCAKIYKFLEQSQTSSKRLRQMISDYRGKNIAIHHDDTMTGHDSVSDSMIKSEENRTELEQNRTRTGGEESAKRSKARHPTLDVPMNQTTYDRLCEDYGQDTTDRYMQKAVDYIATTRPRKPYADYAAAARQYLDRDGIAKVRRARICPSCGKQMVGTLCVDCGYEDKT